MPRGSKYLPVMEVLIGEVASREFEIYDSGTILNIDGAVCDISASFNDTNKFTSPMVVTDGAGGLLTLAGADRYDEEGDWEASIKIVDDGETVYSEEFIIRVKTPGGR